jgi:ABC-type spermidine/putrescine transport system permease subunit I
MTSSALFATKPQPSSAIRRARQWRAATALAACAPAFGLIFLIVVVPIGWLFFLSFRNSEGFTLHHYARMLDNPGYALSLETTLLTSALVTIFSAVLAYPVGYFIAAQEGGRANVVLLLVLVPLWTALLVRTFAWMVLLQRTGPINAALLKSVSQVR